MFVFTLEELPHTNMAASKWMWGFVLGTAFLFWILYAMVHEMKAEKLLIEYQVEEIYKTLNIHTDILGILRGSHYELHNKLDQLMKEK